MKFKGIITEAMIDNLPMGKFDKGILKLIHKELTSSDTPQNFTPGEINSFLRSLATKSGIDMHQMVSLYMTYEKYKEFLFSEEGVEKVTNYDVLSPELKQMTLRILMGYLSENYEGKEVFNSGGLIGEFTFVDDIDMMIEEEMLPETWLRMDVDGEYESTVNYGNNKGETYTTTDTDFNGALYLNVLPTNKGYGFDFNAFNDSFGDWMLNHEGRKYSDMVDSGYVKQSYLKPPLNYSEKELKGFCERWFAIAKRIIGKNLHFLQKYKDFVEHGGYAFENNKKRKTIK